MVGRNLNSSEDELSGIFTFDPTPNSLPASPSVTAVSTSNNHVVVQTNNNNNNLNGHHHHQVVVTPSDPMNGCKSPYENVCMPQSPRTRIRTTLGKSKDEVVVNDNSNQVPSIPQQQQQQHTYQLITSGVAAEVRLKYTDLLERQTVK